jgi:putative endonuclease
MNYYVYMLKCIIPKIKNTYVGYTNNLVKRLKKHNNSKGAKSTKGLKWQIIYKKKILNKSKAMSFEYSLKKNRKERLVILNSNKIIKKYSE